MNAEQVVRTCDRAMKALLGTKAHISVFPGSSDTVREVGRLWGVAVDEFPGLRPGEKIVSVLRSVDGVTVGVQVTEAVPEPECTNCGEPAQQGHGLCPDCEAAGPCSKCGDPVLPTGSGIQPDGDICGDCVERADDARRTKERRDAELESTRGDYLRDQRKNGVRE